MARKGKPPEWKFVDRYGVVAYECGLKQGDKVRLKNDLPVRRHDGALTGDIHRAGEIWNVLSGSSQDAGVVWLLQPNGKRHTWNDDASIFDFFEKLLP